MVEHDHNFLSTKGPGQFARDPLSGLRAVTGGAEAQRIEAEAAVEPAHIRTETTYTVYINRSGPVPLATAAESKTGIRIFEELPLDTPANKLKFAEILATG